MTAFDRESPLTRRAQDSFRGATNHLALGGR
jgi:hypothetical protein